MRDPELKLLYEATRDQLLTKTATEQPKVKRRSKGESGHPMAAQYRGVKGNVIEFRTTSITTPGVKYWDQKIQIKKPGKRTLNKAGVMRTLKGQVKVKCTCPAFKYWGYQYILGGLQSLFGRGRRPAKPRINNPKLKGALCKHLYKVLTVLPGNLSKIVRDLRKGNSDA